MAGFTMSEWISRSPRDVFDFVTSPGNATKVAPSVRSMVQISDGPVGVGTRYRETRTMRGKDRQAELEVVAFEPPQDYAIKNLTEGIETVYRFAFRPEANGTRAELVCDVTASGGKKLMLPLVAAVLKKEDGDHLKRVKKLLET